MPIELTPKFRLGQRVTTRQKIDEAIAATTTLTIYNVAEINLKPGAINYRLNTRGGSTVNVGEQQVIPIENAKTEIIAELTKRLNHFAMEEYA